jgi:hypothetical protein
MGAWVPLSLTSSRPQWEQSQSETHFLSWALGRPEFGNQCPGNPDAQSSGTSVPDRDSRRNLPKFRRISGTCRDTGFPCVFVGQTPLLKNKFPSSGGGSPPETANPKKTGVRGVQGTWELVLRDIYISFIFIDKTSVPQVPGRAGTCRELAELVFSAGVHSSMGFKK